MSEPNEATAAEPVAAEPVAAATVEPDATPDESRAAKEGATPLWKRWLGKR